MSMTSNAAPVAIALLGFALGMRHATDADHVVALTTIVSSERRLGVAARIGLTWGLGHTFTVFVVGVAIIFFKIAIPPRVGLSMELAVAIMLVLLGVPATVQAFRPLTRRIGSLPTTPEPSLLVHSHSHAHDGHLHSHPHVHADGETFADHRDHRLIANRRFSLRHPLGWAFGVGMVHGLAGSAAIALLVLGAIPKPEWAALYLVIFGVGTMVGMMVITTAIALPFTLAGGAMMRLNRAFVIGSGLLSFGFGLALVYQIGVVDGLFRATAIWTPH
jgi:ABC-type nickel/cobalt efflux system permease component RcnA